LGKVERKKGYEALKQWIEELKKAAGERSTRVVSRFFDAGSWRDL